MVPHIQTTIRFTHASYTFLSLLPVSENIALPGKRLNDTAAQRQGKVHGDNVFLQMPVRKHLGKLDTHFDDGVHLEDDVVGVFAGETRREVLKIVNSGNSEASDLWLLFPPDGSICVEDKSETSVVNGKKMSSHHNGLPTNYDLSGRIQITESLDRPAPHRLENVTLQPGQTFECPVLLHHQGSGSVTLSVLVVFREVRQNLSVLSEPNGFSHPRRARMLVLSMHLGPSESLGSSLCWH